jgi:hypothetical protein
METESFLGERSSQPMFLENKVSRKGRTRVGNEGAGGSLLSFCLQALEFPLVGKAGILSGRVICVDLHFRKVAPVSIWWLKAGDLCFDKGIEMEMRAKWRNIYNNPIHVHDIQ